MQDVVQGVDDQIHNLARRVPLGRWTQDRQFEIGPLGDTPDGQGLAEIGILFRQAEILTGGIEQAPDSDRRIDGKAEKILDRRFGTALQHAVHDLAGQRQVRSGIDDQVHCTRFARRLVA